jgi:hypothetical protein
MGLVAFGQAINKGLGSMIVNHIDPSDDELREPLCAMDDPALAVLRASCEVHVYA